MSLRCYIKRISAMSISSNEACPQATEPTQPIRPTSGPTIKHRSIKGFVPGLFIASGIKKTAIPAIIDVNAPSIVAAETVHLKNV